VASLVQAARTDNLEKILSSSTTAKAAAQWFVQTGLLQQFQLAAQIEEEKIEDYKPLPEPETWGN
jgi:hypothetical protein